MKNLEKVNVRSSAVRISIDIGTKLYLQIDGVDFILQSMFIGMETNEYIIIKSPSSLFKIKHKLFRGNDIVVKYVCKGIHTFQTRVIEHITKKVSMAKPLSMLIIEYPKIIQSHDPRSHTRMHCFIPSTITGKNNKGVGAVLDISRVGCRWQMKATLKEEKIPSFSVNEKVTVECKSPGVKESLILVGDVRTIKRNKQELTLGVLFRKRSQEVQNEIAHYLLSSDDSFQPTEKLSRPE